jgi:hypothetical protein
MVAGGRIVISYEPTLVAFDRFRPPLIFANKLIGTLAGDALSLNFAIRSGVTLGPLHHRPNVVVGKALIEAYELESNVANYSRIVVSRNLYSKLDQHPSEMIRTDRDGIRYYDYFQSMIIYSGKANKELESWYGTYHLVA